MKVQRVGKSSNFLGDPSHKLLCRVHKIWTISLESHISRKRKNEGETCYLFSTITIRKQYKMFSEQIPYKMYVQYFARWRGIQMGSIFLEGKKGGEVDKPLLVHMAGSSQSQHFFLQDVFCWFCECCHCKISKKCCCWEEAAIYIWQYPVRGNI